MGVAEGTGRAQVCLCNGGLCTREVGASQRIWGPPSFRPSILTLAHTASHSHMGVGCFHTVKQYPIYTLSIFILTVMHLAFLHTLKPSHSHTSALSHTYLGVLTNTIILTH